MKPTKKVELSALLRVVLIIATTFFQSCRTDNNELSSDVWIAEELNDELTISFPETYIGSGRQPNEEGFQFFKQRQDNKVVFAMSGETFFLNYGESISKPLPDAYGRFVNYKDIFKENELQGRFYYLQNNDTSFRQSDGVYFVKRNDNEFSQVIGVSYSIDTFDEVVKILENIKKK
jgi:hypothetical protein